MQVSLASALADFVQDVRVGAASADAADPGAQSLLIHIFDTIGVMAAGLRTTEARTARRAIDMTRAGSVAAAGASGARLPCADLAMWLAVGARMTEADDIDIGSCTTPGSVAVATALAIALTAAAPVAAEDFLAAVLCGYEVMTALGTLADGPHILSQGTWPTCLCATASSAAVASRLWGLPASEAASALGMALATSCGPGLRGAGDVSGRWLVFGAAVRAGVMAAAGAAAGFAVQPTPAPSGPFKDVGAAPGDALDGLGARLPRVGLKPYSTARQGLAGVEGFSMLLRECHIEPHRISQVEISVPEHYREMIARLPATGQESVSSVAYRCALSAFHPRALFDVERRQLHQDGPTRSLMSRVSISAAPDLTAMYPRRWPARTRIVTAAGQEHEITVECPRGDPEKPLGWSDVAEKLKALEPHSIAAQVDDLQWSVQHLGGDGAMADVLHAVRALLSGASPAAV